MCKYEMDLASIVEDTEWTWFGLQTYGQTDRLKTVYPLNFVGDGGGGGGGIIIISYQFSWKYDYENITAPSLCCANVSSGQTF